MSRGMFNQHVRRTKSTTGHKQLGVNNAKYISDRSDTLIKHTPLLLLSPDWMGFILQWFSAPGWLLSELYHPVGQTFLAFRIQH